VLAGGRLAALAAPAEIIHATDPEVRTLLDTMPSIPNLKSEI